MQISTFTFSGCKLDLNLFMIKPAQLNTFSTGTDVAVVHNILFANNDRAENLVHRMLNKSRK